MSLKAPETSLEIYKNIYFTSCAQKTANAMGTNMEKKHIFWYCRGWYKELKVKEFCV